MTTGKDDGKWYFPTAEFVCLVGNKYYPDTISTLLVA